MVEFRNILCSIDLSDASARPLAYAAALARWYMARLTVLHVVPTFEPMRVRSGSLGDQIRIVHPMAREQVLDELRRALNGVRTETLDVTLAAEAGNAVATIVDRAVAMPADLLVMATHGRSGFDRFLLGSVTEKVLRKAPCPILTVPPHAPAEVPVGVTLKRILCPVDFSPSALQAFGLALDLSQQVGGSVTVLHVIEWLAGEIRAHAHFNVQDYRRHLVEDAHFWLQALIAGHPRTECDIEDVVVTGRAYREILETAVAREAHLIVMGAQGRGGMDLTLFGSTTQQVVRAATCPMLTVRG